MIVSEAGYFPNVRKDEVLETSLRRRIRAELVEIAELLCNSGRDEMTEVIRDWHKKFSSFLDSDDIEPVINNFARSLKVSLIDCKSFAPLDQKALLGSDGRTYGYKSLSVYLSEVREEYKSRSPYNPNDETPFTVSPHPLVRHMVKWLERFTPEVQTQESELERAFRLLEEQNRLPPLPTLERAAELEKGKNDLERIRQITQEVFEMKPAAPQPQGLLSKRFEVVRDKIKAERESVFGDLYAELDAMKREVLAKQNAVEKEIRQDYQELNEAARLLQAGIDTLRTENSILQARIADVTGHVSDIEKNNARLQFAINETLKRDKKRKKRWVKQLIKTVVIVALCVFGAYALQAALAAASAPVSASAQPAADGFMIKTSIRF